MKHSEMTVQEAIEVLQLIYMNTQGKCQQACEMAIDALAEKAKYEDTSIEWKKIDELVKQGVDPAYFFEVMP